MSEVKGRVVSNDGNTITVRSNNGSTKTIGRLDKSADGSMYALEYNGKPLTQEEFQEWFPVGLDGIAL